MRRIRKMAEPSLLSRWKHSHPNERSYKKLSDDVRYAIREKALEEQYYLCAYCCCSINSADPIHCHNEHMEPRAGGNSGRELDFSNIVASCNTRNQCGTSHKSQPLPLLPIMNECETELQFMISGRVRGLSKRAEDTIRILNLGDSEKNNKALIEKRKTIVQAILMTNGVGSEEQIEDEEIVQMLIADISCPRNGRLDAYAPVAANVVNSWI